MALSILHARDRRGPLTTGERVAAALGAVLLAIAIALFFAPAARSQDVGPDAVMKPAPSAPVQNVIVGGGDRSGWDKVIDAVQNFILVLVAALVGLIGVAAWLARGWLIRKFGTPEKDAAVQAMKADDANTKGEALALLLREKAMERPLGPAREELLAHADKVERSKISVINPKSLPPDRGAIRIGLAFAFLLAALIAALSLPLGGCASRELVTPKPIDIDCWEGPPCRCHVGERGAEPWVIRNPPDSPHKCNFGPGVPEGRSKRPRGPEIVS